MSAEKVVFTKKFNENGKYPNMVTVQLKERNQ